MTNAHDLIFKINEMSYEFRRAEITRRLQPGLVMTSSYGLIILVLSLDSNKETVDLMLSHPRYHRPEHCRCSSHYAVSLHDRLLFVPDINLITNVNSHPAHKHE